MRVYRTPCGDYVMEKRFCLSCAGGPEMRHALRIACIEVPLSGYKPAIWSSTGRIFRRRGTGIRATASAVSRKPPPRDRKVRKATVNARMFDAYQNDQARAGTGQPQRWADHLKCSKSSVIVSKTLEGVTRSSEGRELAEAVSPPVRWSVSPGPIGTES